MSNEINPVYALNVNLFACILKSAQALNSTNLFKKEPEEFKNIYEGILNNFSNKIPDISKDFPKLRQTLPDSDRYDLLDCELEDSRQYFLFSSEANNQISGESQLLYNLLLYPQNIGDSYSLLINIFRPQSPGLDRVNCDEISDFNPKQCLILEKDDFFIGQTLLITAFLPRSKPDNPEELRFDAEHLLKKLLISCPELSFPEFYQAENFLNSYILEFSKPKKSLVRYLVLFYFDDSTSEQLEKIYWDLPELFLYYHKITHVYQMSRQSADEIDLLIREQIEAQLPSFSNQDSEQSQLSEPLNLEQLKTTLKNLLKTAPKYTLKFRELEDALNSININTRNYQRTLKRLQAQANDNLDFFSRFAERESQTFQLQIQADLNYSKPGAQLLDQAISSIRGLVEIDQAESDRNLQKTIQSVGFGIGVAGVVATSAPYWIKQEPEIIPINKPFISSSLNTFTFIILVSLSAGLLTWGIASGWMNGKSLIAGGKQRCLRLIRRKTQTSLPTSQSQPINDISQQPEEARSQPPNN
ncbi:MAG TPA: hypothetical protein VK211_17380 [Kamptonema sp.]|nr:hypothetical protein [Kamptonema sp.]